MDNEKIRPAPDKALGWAYRPDSDTVAAHNRLKAKLKRTHFNLGADKPHEGGSGNLAEALAEASKAEATRRFGKRRRRKMAKRVTLKELHSRKGKSVKKTAPPSKKKTVLKAKEEKSSSKLIPLKTLCNELDLDPKATRVKLRRLIAKGEIEFHDHSARWEFTPKQANQIRAALGSE